MSTGPMAQSAIACALIAYIVFCFLYGHASLKSRRLAAAAAQGPAMGPASRSLTLARSLRHLFGVAGGLLLPILVIATVLSFAGRERGGVIETGGLFTVPARPDATVSFLSSGATVAKGDIVAGFASDTIEFRMAGLRARRQALIATRDALQSGFAPLSQELQLKIQSEEQRLAQADQKLVEIERTAFVARQQLLTGDASWQRSRAELTARLPALEQSLASEKAEQEAASRALARMRILSEKGYATVTQLERLETATTVAGHRTNTTLEALRSTHDAIATLDASHRLTRELLAAQLGRLDTEAAAATARKAEVSKTLLQLRPTVARNEQAAILRRDREIAAANARIDELDSEIGALLAQTEVKSPISGRVLYRNAASSTLSGALPLMIVASDEGFLMRIDVSRDELPALERDAADGRKLDALLDDSSARRLAPARLARVDDTGLDTSRVTAVFAIEMPEDMVVRMALKGSAPRGYLRWTPPIQSVVLAKIASIVRAPFAAVPVAVDTKRPAPQPVRAPKSQGGDTSRDPIEL